MSAGLIPGSIRSEIETLLFAPIAKATSIQGGDISKAFKIELEDGQSFFLKFDKEELDTMKSIFTQEVKGLNTLRSANTSLVIPEVISHNNSYLLVVVVLYHMFSRFARVCHSAHVRFSS